jgi:hypothetical protein
MKKLALIAAAILALAVAPSLAEAQVTHVTIEGGTMSFNFPANQDTLVSHFEMCVAVGATPVACTSASTGFAPVSITSKAADPTQPSLNLYKVGPPLPAALVPNAAGQSTLIVVRACTGTAVGSGCAAVSASAAFILDLSSPTNLKVQ